MRKVVWVHHPWIDGKPDDVARTVLDLKCDTVIMKMSDGGSLYAESLYRKARGENTEAYVKAFKAAGLHVRGFHWGRVDVSVGSEISAIAKAIERYKPEPPFCLNMEANYNGQIRRADDLMAGLRPDMQYSLSSGRFPYVFPASLNWPTFLNVCTLVEQQIYFYGVRTVAGAKSQTFTSMEQYDRKYREIHHPEDPYLPALPTHKWRDWKPTPDQLDACVESLMSWSGKTIEGVSFFVLEHLTLPDMTELYDWVRDLKLDDGVEPPPPPPVPKGKVLVRHTSNVDMAVELDDSL
ncbi:hypothetical protein ES705_07287 [subsurface metagenome]